VGIIKISIEAKHWKHPNHLVKQNIIDMYCHIIQWSQIKVFFFKFPIFKWSFVDLKLFKKIQLTKYMIYTTIHQMNEWEKQVY